MNIIIIDIVFLAVIAIFSIRCAIRGFVSELMSMAALIFGLITAIFLFRRAAVFVRDRFMPDVKTVPEIISFIVLFLSVFAVIKIIERLLKGIIDGIKLDGPDHFLGFVLGFAEGILVVCLLLFLLHIQPFVPLDTILEESFFDRLLMPFIMGGKRGDSNSADSIVKIIDFYWRTAAGV